MTMAGEEGRTERRWWEPFAPLVVVGQESSSTPILLVTTKDEGLPTVGTTCFVRRGRNNGTDPERNDGVGEEASAERVTDL
jgi:hypothetical protein